MMSMAVPGVIGAMSVTERFGYGSCARARPSNPIRTAAAIAESFKCIIAFLPPTEFAAFRSVDRDRAHRRGFGADHLQRQADQRETVLLDAVEVLEVGHGD